MGADDIYLLTAMVSGGIISGHCIETVAFILPSLSYIFHDGDNTGKVMGE